MKICKIFFVSLCALTGTTLAAQTQRVVETFHLSDVELLDSPFKSAQDKNLEYLLALEPDRLLAPFLREAGLPAKAESYTNWENTGLDGHIGGHYLCALSLMYASTGDGRIKQRLDYMLDALERCQEANGNGYIGGVPGGKTAWDEIAAGNIRAARFSLNDKWVPLYNIHKTYAGLRDAWLYAGDERAKQMLVRMADWAAELVSRLSDAQIQDMLGSEHGGLNETFADVAAITGDERYLRLARRFSHREILDPLLRKEDRLTGMHANTQIPKVIGYKRIADAGGNDEWSDAAGFFWETVVENRSVSIGGNSASEHFHSADDFSRMIDGIQGPETCNTYNMLRLSKMLYETSSDKRYTEYYERALYNHILSTQHPENGGLVYFTQMRPGHYRVYSQPHTSMWCCVGSGMENHSKYGEMIYAHTDNDLYVNLFIPSRLEWKEKGVEVVQENSFPDEPRTTLTIDPVRKMKFALRIRYPDWVGEGEMRVSVNGKTQRVTKDVDGYVSLERKWRRGDRVEVEMPMHISAEQLPDGAGYYSFLYGPIVLAARSEVGDLVGLYADDSRMGHEARGSIIPMKDMPVLVGEPGNIVEKITPIEGKPLAFRLSGLYPEGKWGVMELMPFFRLHDSRYIIYWPQATGERVAALQKEIEEQEEAALRLDAATIDKVMCGMQQPESDHFIEFDGSQTGYTEGNHWREARGWFSYRMRNAGGRAAYLYVAHLDLDRGRRFDIFIDDEKISAVNLEGGEGYDIHEKVFPIPDNLVDQENLTVRLVGGEGSLTAKIVEVRLLNAGMEPEYELRINNYELKFIFGRSLVAALCRDDSVLA